MCMHHIFEASATVEESEPCAIIGRTDCSQYHGRAVALAEGLLGHELHKTRLCTGLS